MRAVEGALRRFTAWVEAYGETSYDHQSFFAGGLGRRAKALYYRMPWLGTLAVAPMIFGEAFVPSTRCLFGRRQRFPIADAHYAMGFATLADVWGDGKHYARATHFLEILQRTRSAGYDDYCWGYPFTWQTRAGSIPAGTPLITSLPYMYEAFAQVRALDGDPKQGCVMRSIAHHAHTAYRELETGPDRASCGYTPAPNDPCGVVNASAYRAFLLTRAAVDFSEPRYAEAARRNLNYVLDAQNGDGSWHYATDGSRHFVDHFHTCFVLKALAKIEQLTGNSACGQALARGVEYYVEKLFDGQGLPVPFARAPRLTVYRRELYDYAECINLGVLLRGRFPRLDARVDGVMSDLLDRWQKPDGSFRSRELVRGWDNVPMHRWAQSQVFRSLCCVLRAASPVSGHGSAMAGTRSSGHPTTRAAEPARAD